MNKLLAANFMRLKKSKAFWLCVLFMAGYGILLAVTYYRSISEGMDIILENGVFSYVPFVGILAAAFISLFVGTEYSDGTIRNKVVMGHTRGNIYLANLLTSTAAVIFMDIVFLAVYSSLGTVLFGWFTAPFEAILLMILCSLVLAAAFSAIFTLITMLNQNKAVTAVVAVLLAFVLLFAGSYIINRLGEPEYYSGVMMNESGQVVKTEPQKNPRYLSGTEREVYQFAGDFLPGGQSIQLASFDVAHPWRLMGYSAIITVVTTAAGVLVFRRKDLK